MGMDYRPGDLPALSEERLLNAKDIFKKAGLKV
jgi:pyruvate formate lyase activating enzyme